MPLQPITPSSDPTFAQRQALVLRWLWIVKEVARESKDDEALEVAHFLDEHASVAIPDSRNSLRYVARDGLADADTVRIVPMIAVDYWRLAPEDYWSIYATSVRTDNGNGAEAEYYPPNQAIYIPAEWSRSDMQTGALLLHEGLHAYDYLVRREHMPKPFWRRECNAQVLEIRVYQALGGSVFFSYLDSLGPPIAAGFSHSENFFFEIPPELRDEELLDRCLWATANPVDRRERRYDVQRCAVARYFERKFGSQSTIELYGEYVRKHFIGTAHAQHLEGLK